MINLPYPTRTPSTPDRIWDVTRDRCQELADKWGHSKIFTYDVAIQFAALFDTPEELVALAEHLGELRQTLQAVLDAVADDPSLQE